MTMKIIWTTQTDMLEMEQLFYNSIDINIDSEKITSFIHAPAHGLPVFKNKIVSKY